MSELCTHGNRATVLAADGGPGWFGSAAQCRNCGRVLVTVEYDPAKWIEAGGLAARLTSPLETPVES